MSNHIWLFYMDAITYPWASCQIRKIADCACARNAGNVFPPPRVSDPDMHHGTCVTHVTWCMPELLTSGFFQSQWRGKRSRHSRRMRNPKFYVSGKNTKAQRRWLIQYLLTGGAFHVELSKCFLGRNMSRQISPAYWWKNILIEMYHCKFIFVRKFTWW